MTRRDSIYEIDNNKHEIDNIHENTVKKYIIEISNNLQVEFPKKPYIIYNF